MIFGLYHSATEEAGLIAEVLKAEGIPFRPVHLHDGDGLPRNTSDLEGLVVMGGPMNVDDIAEYPFLLPEVQLIDKVLSARKPVLGVCLGAQLIAKALGSRVYPNDVKELGWGLVQRTPAGARDAIFRELPDKVDVLHWHGDTFDLPDGAVHLAKSARCENQAFRWGDNTYGLQFHLEVTPAMTHRWCTSSEGKKEIAAAGEDANKILRQTPGAFSKLEPHARRFFGAYARAAFAPVRSSVA